MYTSKRFAKVLMQSLTEHTKAHAIAVALVSCARIADTKQLGWFNPTHRIDAVRGYGLKQKMSMASSSVGRAADC